MDYLQVWGREVLPGSLLVQNELDRVIGMLQYRGRLRISIRSLSSIPAALLSATFNKNCLQVQKVLTISLGKCSIRLDVCTAASPVIVHVMALG
jgi:hypothetical protein